jgi:hypothetical protein
VETSQACPEAQPRGRHRTCRRSYGARGRRQRGSLSGLCGPKRTPSLHQILLEPAEPLPMEAHSGVTLCQQGMEVQLGWLCTIETTSTGNTSERASSWRKIE